LFNSKLNVRKLGLNIPLIERSNIIFFARGGGLLKPSECRHMGKGRLAKSSCNFYSGWKSL